MEEEYPSSSSNHISVPMIVAVVGCLFGVAGLIFGMNAKNTAALQAEKIASVEATVEATMGAGEQAMNLASRVVALEEQVADIAQANNALALQVNNANQQLQSLAQQTQSALNKVSQELASNHKRIEESINGFTGSSSSRGGRTERSSDTASEGGDNTYVIKSGDTFSGIAARLKVKLSDLIAANPDVDPHYLHVGQTIRLPE